jgi:hypothetical protein
MNHASANRLAKARAPLAGSLGLADRLIYAAEAVMAQGPTTGVGVIDLPPVLGAEGDQAQLRTIAPLYLFSELENAGLLAVTEKLASLLAVGGLQADPGRAAAALAAFWQKRNERFSTSERLALFTRIFGPGESSAPGASPASSNDEFLSLMIEFAGALNHMGSDILYGHTPDAEQAVRSSAEALASALLPKAGGIALFAAREIASAIREAMSILESSSIQAMVGQHTVWGAVQTFGRLYLGRELQVSEHVDRGRAGSLLLAWIAETSPHLEDGLGASIVPDNSTIAAAAAWLEATSTLMNMHADPSLRGS